MSQQVFRERNQTGWEETGEMLELLERRKPVFDVDTFPARFRKTCQQLALARYRRYSGELIDGLNRLALRGHQQLYTQRAHFAGQALGFIASGFPRLIRAEWRLLLLSTLLFFGTGLAAYLAIRTQPELVYTLLGPGRASQMEMMYNPASNHFLRERASDSDLLMFGFYIRNNIGIGFQTYASGLLGIGSPFFLMLNGLFIGGAAGHIDNVGFGSTFYTFVIGHGSFELTAIVLAGVAGMKLGATVLAPGRRTRRRALLEEGKRSAKIVYGFTGMLLIAAFLEAFWSSSTYIPGMVKIAVGAVLWAAVIGYFAFAGAGRGAR